MNTNELNIQFNQLIERFETSIKKFDSLNSESEIYLVNEFADIKDKIIIQRDTLNREINKISAVMIETLDKNLQKCLDNLPKFIDERKANVKSLNETKAAVNDQNLKINDHLKFSSENRRLQSLFQDIKQKIDKNEMNMAKFETKIKMNQTYSFIPVKCDSIQDFFGNLIIKEAKKGSEFRTTLIKSINDPYNKLLLPIFDVQEDSNKLAIMNVSQDVLVFNLVTGEYFPETYRDEDPENEISNLKWISKSKIAIAMENMVKIWDTEQPNCFDLVTLAGHIRKIRCICFNKINNSLMTGSYDGQIEIWDLNDNNRCIKTIKSNSIVHCITFNQDGYTIASIGKEIRILDTELKLKLSIKTDEADIVDLTPNGDLICSSRKNTIQILDFNTGNILKSFDLFNSQKNPIFNVSFLKFISKTKFMVVFNTNLRYHEVQSQIFDLNQTESIEEFNTVCRFKLREHLCLLNNGNLMMLDNYDDSKDCVYDDFEEDGEYYYRRFKYRHRFENNSEEEEEQTDYDDDDDRDMETEVAHYNKQPDFFNQIKIFTFN